MSGDDIVFGDITVREPERCQRPDRDRRFASIAYELPGPSDLPIFIDRRAADAIERHALSDTTVELGGILLGKECVDPSTGQPFVWITRSLEAKHYANTQASFTYTHDSWQEITRERDLNFPEFDIVGWYHTHPSFGIFLSSHDLFIHQNFFAQPLQVAYVVDPINQTRGFFQWKNSGLAQVEGYFVTADRGDRLALARLVNDLENFPNSEGGGGLSPRLEAELINMIHRPPVREAGSQTERLQMAALFGMLGTFAGVLGLAAALWLFQLSGRIQDQNETLREVARSLEESRAGQRLAMDTLLEKTAGATAGDFAVRYDKTAKARDDALEQLGVQRTIADSLGARLKEVEADAAELRVKLQESESLAARSKKAAESAASLRERLAELEDAYARQKARVEELSPLVETESGKNALAMRNELQHARLLAMYGWVVSGILALLLGGGYLYIKPFLGSGHTTAEPPPHQIG